MKPKVILAMFSGLVACSLMVSAQDDSQPAEEIQAASTSAVAQSDASMSEQVDANSAPAEDAAAPDTFGEQEATVAETAAAEAAAPVDAATAVVATPAAISPAAEPADKIIIPLIVMDDVPLTDAVKNLARQANLNYMLDPKLSYGQTGPDGRTVPQPTVSIRWENVTAEQALHALLNNYGLQMIQDPRTKIARVTIKDPAAPDPLVTKIIRLNYASPSNILAAVKTALTDAKRSRVIADIRTSQLVVVATEREMDAVDQMIQKLDTPTKQVLIEAKLVETSINPQTIKGMNWAGTLQGQDLSFGNNLQDNKAEESINDTLSDKFPRLLFDTAHGFNPATAFLDAEGVNVVFSFLNQNADAKVISEPRTVTLDNETAHLEVTRATPIINVTAGTANTTGGSQITYTNLGVILDVTPRISANDYVNLKVVPEVSRKFATVEKTIQDQIFQADEYDLRKIETRVMIPSGNTLVLGGLVQDDIRTGNTKVPLLGDIPGLGFFFRADSKSRQKSNLLVFITPTIVKEEDFQESKSDFLKTPVPQEKIADWSAWDSGKPYDWGKKTQKAEYQELQ